MSAIDWDGNLTHGNFIKPVNLNKKAAAHKTISKFDFND